VVEALPEWEEYPVEKVSQVEEEVGEGEEEVE
jgi:hypothetical protein